MDIQGVTEEDNFGASSSTNEMNFMYSTEEYENIYKLKPNMRVELKLVCPGKTCENEAVLWDCLKCISRIEYGFDYKFYCNCGRNDISKFIFRCSNENHSNFIPFDAEEVLNNCLSNLQPLKELNILVIGQTGVGKSTWINSIVNYMTYDNLDEAETKGLRHVIPSSFTVYDDNYESTEIHIGDEDSNEMITSGQSGTQGPKSYTFNLKDTIVRLIDTPGIGDVRGLDKDKENMQHILDYIGQFSELHGICILMKSNDSRLDVLFRFCIKELLIHLHKSASKNIVFCFTHTRGTYYRPGETFKILKILLKELDLSVVPSKDIIYCMENESFRYLCSLNYQNIRYTKSDKENYKESWNRSVSETSRLLQHIQSLEPHYIIDTTTLCETRRILLNLTKPMADICENIELNIAIIEKHKQEIATLKLSEKGLRKNLYIPSVDIVYEELTVPQTVCTSPECSGYYNFSFAPRVPKYETVCHSECRAHNVVPDQVGHKNLVYCNGIGKHRENCQKCGCKWELHVHIKFRRHLKETSIVNEIVQLQINEKVSLRRVEENVIQEAEETIRQHKYEQKVITKTSARFAQYLKSNTIAPYNDAMKDYIEMLISNTEKKADKTEVDQSIVEGLKNMLHTYDPEVLLLEKTSNCTNSLPINSSGVNNLIQELFSLKLNGAQLKRNVEVAERSNMNAIRFNEIDVDLPPQYKAKKFFKMLVAKGTDLLTKPFI